jgi:hypothetical protein
MEAAFLLVWIGLLGAPILAVVVFVLFGQQPFQVQSVIAAVSVLLLYFGVVCSG